MKLAPVIVACAALGGCGAHDDGTLPGTVERDRIELAAEADEFIVALPVAEGAHVAAGDVIVVQDGTISAAELAAARAQLAEAEARLEELRTGPRTTAIAAAEARRDRARVERDNAVRERDRLLGLVEQNLVSRSEADRQVAAANAAAASLQEAESTLRELREGTRAEQVAQASQAADVARANLRALETSSARLEVRAPVAATVDALPYHVGEKPPRGATVAVLLADGAPYARIHVPAPLRARVKAGAAATLRVDGIDATFRGHVRFVASEAEFTPYYSLTAADRSRLSYLAEVVFDEAPAATVPAGLPVDVTLELGTP